jgi:hypothetical protein
MKKDTHDLTKTMILMPLRKALELHDINEDTVIGVLADILNDDEQPGATRLNAVKMFLPMIGLVNESRQIDMEITHTVSRALDTLQQRRLERQERDIKRIGGQPQNDMELEYVPASTEND